MGSSIVLEPNPVKGRKSIDDFLLGVMYPLCFRLVHLILGIYSVSLLLVDIIYIVLGSLEIN